MKNWISKISKEKLQRFIFIGMLVLVFAVFLISLSLMNSSETPTDDPNISDPSTPNNPSNPINNNDPAEPTPEKIMMPLNEETFSVVRRYYDVSGTAEEQELAVVQFGSMYFISKGISIALDGDKGFDVVACLSGEVTKVEESPIYGVCVTIKHDDTTMSEYSSLSEATVEVGTIVKQGDKIGVSGNCEYDTASKNHVHFKVIKDNVSYNPMSVVGKTIIDLE